MPLVTRAPHSFYILALQAFTSKSGASLQAQGNSLFSTVEKMFLRQGLLTEPAQPKNGIVRPLARGLQFVRVDADGSGTVQVMVLATILNDDWVALVNGAVVVLCPVSAGDHTRAFKLAIR